MRLPGILCGMKLDLVERIKDELKKARVRSDIIVYPDSPHAFHADYRPSYRAEDAHDGEMRMFEWFKNNGVE